MNISLDQIRQLGTLARLELSDQEIEQLSAQLPKIVEYVSQLQTVDTTVVAELAGLETTLRIDQTEPSAVKKAILDQAPERSGQSWKVDAVFS